MVAFTYMVVFGMYDSRGVVRETLSDFLVPGYFWFSSRFSPFSVWFPYFFSGSRFLFLGLLEIQGLVSRGWSTGKPPSVLHQCSLAMKKVSALGGLHPHGRIRCICQSGCSERNTFGFPGSWVLLVLLSFLIVFCLVPFLLLGLEVLVSLGLLEI